MERLPARSFQDLIVWQKAHQFVLSVYVYSANLPKGEMYGLTSQLRRASVSIPANIAEGFKKRGGADKLRFLNIAQGSLEECRYYLILSNDLGYGSSTLLNEQLEEVSRLLEGYMRGIEGKKTGARIQNSESRIQNDSPPDGRQNPESRIQKDSPANS